MRAKYLTRTNKHNRFANHHRSISEGALKTLTGFDFKTLNPDMSSSLHYCLIACSTDPYI